MSLCYPFTLPTTGNLSFSQLRTVEYKQLLLEADGRRALVRDTLKKAKRANSPDLIAIIHAIEGYLPHLFTILQAIDSHVFDEPLPNLVSSWRLPLKVVLNSSAKNSLIEPPRVEIASLQYEKGMVLFTYALTLMAAAESVLSTPVEEGGVSSNDRLKQVSGYLRKVESLFRYLLEQDFSSSPELTRVAELSPTVLGAFITLVSGSVHMATVYKAQEQQSLESSPLYSRVALFAAEKFSSAFQMLSSASALLNSGSSVHSESALSESKSKLKRFHISTTAIKQMASQSPLLNWLESSQKFCIASAEVFMATASYNKNEVGLAVGYLLHAQTNLSSIDKKYLQQASTSHQQLKDRIEDLLRNYQAENDRIAFQPVPGMEAIEQKWPSGREVVPPQEAWKPPQSLLAIQGNFFPTPAAPSKPQSYENQQGYY